MGMQRLREKPIQSGTGQTALESGQDTQTDGIRNQDCMSKDNGKGQAPAAPQPSVGRLSQDPYL